MLKNVVFTFLFCSFFVLNSNAKKIIEYHRVGGVFGLFGSVHQWFHGNDSSGNEHWEVDCSGVGFNRCRWQRTGINNDPLIDFCEDHFTALENYAENKVSDNILSGQKVLKVARSTDSDPIPETLVILTMSWDSETIDFNDGKIIIEIEEVEYPQ